MEFTIGLGLPQDADELERQYDDFIDALAARTNGPGWIKGVTPHGRRPRPGPGNRPFRNRFQTFLKLSRIEK